MDKVKKYRQIVRELIYEIAERAQSSTSGVETFVVEDQEKGHYLLFKDGWKGEDRRFYGCPIHVGVNAQAKVYLYYDMTDYEIGQQLLDRGVVPDDLVPAFQPPSVRALMGYGIA
ncbi:MAG: element excision factor XisI family protein [Bacteroidota bacterium]